MENKLKIVEFNKYCSKCVFSKTNENEDPCNTCLSNAVNENSDKPVNYKEDKKHG